MANVVDQIREWALTLPYWERAALDKIGAGDEVTDEDCERLLGYLLQEKGLTDRNETLPELKLDCWSGNGAGAKIKLVSISDLRDVNALVPAQKITFGPAITAVFGENASGKSGYARVLGGAGFTRGDIHILPNVHKPAEMWGDPAACIEIDDGNGVCSVQFSVNSPSAELHSFHVFDSTSVIAHIAKSHGFSFTPGALTCLPKLAEVTDRVRQILDKKVEECRRVSDFTRLFAGESEVTVLIAGLGPDTDVGRLESLADISAADEENKKQLERQKAELLLIDTTEKVSALTRTIEDLNALHGRLKAVESALDGETISAMMENVTEYLRLQEVARSEGIDQFATEGLSKIGSEEWKAFVLQAKALADVEYEGRDPYPQSGDICLLCKQPLTADARDLIRRLWIYLKAEAQDALAKSEENLKRRRKAIADLDLDFFNEQLVSFRHLESRDQTLLSDIKAYVNSATACKASLLDALDQHRVLEAGTLSPAQTGAVTGMIGVLRCEIANLNNTGVDEELKPIEDKLLLLEHRNTLSRNLEEIKGYINRRRWARKAEGIGGSTRHITMKYNELFEKLVTNEYTTLFEKTLERLGCPMGVRLSTRGVKGNVLKQILIRSLEENESDNLPGPDKVLSEGEKRAVAMADFLTEVTLDEHSGGIVIDDPVTSLDHRWKNTIAECLVAEARCRQVIVFTHDLHFLWMLNEHAKRMSTEIVVHWIKRGDHDGKPGYVFLNNSPVFEKEYTTSKIAREWLRKAKETEQPEEQEALLKQGFGALRTTYEAFVIYELLQGVVTRWNERVSLEGRLDRIVLDPSIVTTVVKEVGEISRYIEGHSHTDTTPRPTVKALQEEIESFDKLKSDHKTLVKAAGKN